MNLFGMIDPAQMGVLILLVLAAFGVIAVKLILRMPEKSPHVKTGDTPAAAANVYRPSIRNEWFKKIVSGEQPRRGFAPAPNTGPLREHSVSGCHDEENSDRLDLNAQWDRFIGNIAETSAASHRAYRHHTTATTQLDAAEFSMSELFREYPNARVQLNPVTYVEFPALKPLPVPDDSEDQPRNNAVA